MKWLIIILTVLMMGCFEDESVQECGTDQVFNDTVGACVLDKCKTGLPDCHQGCTSIAGSGVGEYSELGEGYFYPSIGCIIVTGEPFKVE